MALKAAFLFFDDADLTNFKAADLTRVAGVRLFAVLRLTVRFFAVVLHFADRLPVDFLRLKNAMLFRNF
jgi:hypothetical protein